MELRLIGHDYKYAVEQSLLTLFPGNKPEYPEKKGKGDHITVRCSLGKQWTSMTTVIRKDGNNYYFYETLAAALEAGAPPDAACTMAESALSSLAELDGRGVCEDIISEVFARFCVGK